MGLSCLAALALVASACGSSSLSSGSGSGPQSSARPDPGGGKTYTITIRPGAQWNTSPATPVTAADAVPGLKRSCNPVQPFGGLPDFISLIKGYASFCAGFAKVKPTVPAIRAYVNSHQISGVTASGQTITYNLNQSASYFADELTLEPFSPAPPASLNYLP
jgi:peptide/nickel transport system substrate-binding protein